MDALITQTHPTVYFIGVTTKQSSIMNVFPRWSDMLGLGAQIVGYDAPIHAPAEVYRAIVQHIKNDPMSLGALVTTHKIDLLAACRDLFDDLDPYAEICGEISLISKRDGRLCGVAKDPISAGLAWNEFVPRGYWAKTQGHVLCLGAGGAAVAISVFLSEQAKADSSDMPHKFTIVDILPSRLEELKHIHARLQAPIAFEYSLTADAAVNDALMHHLPPGSAVINATGMGKDRPGSPITDAAIFPKHGLVWELNYRGALDFLHQAKRQTTSRHLLIEDGWRYFLHGWTQFIVEVFQIDLTREMFNQLGEAASAQRSK